ncbi:hypothetical protein [Phaeobacter phage MD18]|nr:hypothetical protein [Phaeobacter phage MD18]
MSYHEEEASAPRGGKAEGITFATREELGVPAHELDRLGVTELSYADWRAILCREAAEAAERRTEELMDEWDAEMSPRDILFAGEAPRNRTNKISLKCGCKHGLTFEANLYSLSRLPREGQTCPRCWEASKPDQLKEIIETKGGTLLSAYSGAHTKVRVRCMKGHVFEATPANLTRGGGKRGSWCPDCHELKGKLKLAEVLAERGCELTEYGKWGTQQTKFYTTFDGTPAQGTHSALMSNPPTYPTKRGPRQVRTFYDDDTMRAYVLADLIPPYLPRVIAEVVGKMDFETVGVAPNLSETSALVKKAIAADNEIGDYKVLNVLHNDQWINPGVYRWGNIDRLDGTLIEMDQQGA